MATQVVMWKQDGMPLGVLDDATVNLQPGDVYVKEPVVYYDYTFAMPATPAKFDKLGARLSRDKALAYVNVARTALGYRPLDDLPKGNRGNGNSCVIARAIPGTVSVGGYVRFLHERIAKKVGDAWLSHQAGALVATPALLGEFINRFDNGQYPDLTL